MQQAPAQNKSRFFWEGEQRGKVKPTEKNKTAREGGCSIQERAHTKIKKGCIQKLQHAATLQRNTLQRVAIQEAAAKAFCCNPYDGEWWELMG